MPIKKRYTQFEVTDRISMHSEPCPIRNPSLYLEPEVRISRNEAFRKANDELRFIDQWEIIWAIVPFFKMWMIHHHIRAT